MRAVRFFLCIVGMLLVAGPGIVSGYVLPGPFVIELMLQHLNLPQKFSVQQTLQIQNDRYSDAAPAYKQIARYQLSGQFRSDITDEFLTHTHMTVADRSVTVVDGAIVSESEDWQDYYKDLFLYRSRQRLTHRLSVMHVDTEVSSFGRFDDAICYVIGARYPDLDTPQLWIEKTYFRPVRLIVIPSGAAGGPPAAEIRFSEWRRIEQTWYPGLITFLEYGETVRTIQVDKLEINPFFSSDLFDIDALKAANQIRTAPFRDDASEEIQQQIEEFKKIYE